jgi:hypothetical protein
MTTINWLTQFREIIAVYSENHTKHINTLSRQNSEVMDVKAGGTCRYHSARGLIKNRLKESENMFH